MDSSISFGIETNRARGTIPGHNRGALGAATTPSSRGETHATGGRGGSIPGSGNHAAGGSIPGRGNHTEGGIPGGGSSRRLRNKELKQEVARYNNGLAPGMEEYIKLGYCTGYAELGFAKSTKQSAMTREYHLVVKSIPNTFRYSNREHRDEHFMKIAMADQNGNELSDCGNLSHTNGSSLESKGRAINAPPLFFNEGERAKIIVHNQSKTPMTIHWHGIFLETKMDGIPGFQMPILQNSTFKYEFELTQNGTYWYHPHDLNEQDTRGAIIIFAAPKGQLVKQPDGSIQASPGEWITYPNKNAKINTSYNHDRMIMMSDYMNRAPGKILNLLNNDQDSYMFDSGYSRGFFEQPQCLSQYKENFKTMKMFWMDPADVWYDLFLLNDETCLNCGPWKNKLDLVRSESPNQIFNKLNEFSQFTKNDRIRLRLINSSASSYFHVNFGNSQKIADPKQKLDMLVVAKDGQAVEPIYTDALYMGMGETYDVIIDIPNDKTLYELSIKSIDDYDPETNDDGTVLRESRRLARVLIGDGSEPVSDTKVVQAYNKSIKLCEPKVPEKDLNYTPPAEADPILPIRYDALKRRTAPAMMPDLPPIKDPLQFPKYNGDHVLQKLKLFGNMEDYYWQIKPDDKNTKFKYFKMDGMDMPYIEIANSRYNFIQIKNTMLEGMMNHPWHLHGLYFKLLTPEELKLDANKIDQLLQLRPLLHTATIKPGEIKVIAFYASNDYRGAWMFHCHNLYHMASDMMMFVKYDNFDFSELPVSHNHSKKGHQHGDSNEQDEIDQGHGGHNGSGGDASGAKNQIVQIQDFLLDTLGVKNGFVTGGMTVMGGVNPMDGSPRTLMDANVKTRINGQGGRYFAEIVTGVTNQNLSGNEMSFYGSGRICSEKKCATLSYAYETEKDGIKSHRALAGFQYRVFNSDILVLNGAVGAVCKSDPNNPNVKMRQECGPAGDFNAAIQWTNGKIGAFNQLIPHSQTVYRGQFAIGCKEDDNNLNGNICANIYGRVGGEALINRNLKLVAFCKITTEHGGSECMAGISIMLDPIYNFGKTH